MSRKPENTFRDSVHKYIDPDDLHHEKMSNPYRSGGADDWYSGKGCGSKDLWIEWKFLVLPKRDSTLIDLVGGKNPPLTALQQEWLRERYYEGRNVWVGVGCKDGGVILQYLDWEEPMETGAFRKLIFPRGDLARRIVNFVKGK